MEKKVFYFAVFIDNGTLVVTDATTNTKAFEDQINFFKRKIIPDSKNMEEPKRFMLIDEGKETNAINIIKEGFEQPTNDRRHSNQPKRKYNKRKFNGIHPNDTSLKARKLRLGLIDREIAASINESGFNVNRVLNDKHDGISEQAFNDTYRKMDELFKSLEK